MNAAYVALGPERSPGVHQKMAAQVRALRRQGLPIAALYVTSEEGRIPGYEEYIDTLTLPYHLIEQPWAYYAYWRDTYAAMNEWMNSRNFDVVYMRYPGADPILYRWILKTRMPVVFEHQSKLRVELANRRDAVAWIRLGLDVAFGRAVLRRAAAHVAVTSEIGTYLLGLIRNPGTCVRTITNGIDVEAVPLRRAPAPSPEGLRMLFVGDFHPWQGLDRLIAGLTAYRGGRNITLVVAGAGGGSSTGSLPAGVQVDYQGRQTGKALDHLFDTSHVAVASLGVHRKGLAEAAPLKTREYLARGIPFIISHRDPDISGQPGLGPYVLHVPPDDTAVDIDAVIRFAARVSGDRDHAAHMRRWAQEHVDMPVKMRLLKDLLIAVKESA